MWETVDLRELRAFLTLADELHFGRTAERLRLTPSRVSQAIRALEHKLQLTVAGERVQREASAV
jgi:DNA-binding transcriptional LysR family regulator